jgi:hypothetical protein
MFTGIVLITRSSVLKINRLFTLFIINLFFFAFCNAETLSVNSQEISNDLQNISARFHPNSSAFNVFADLIVWTAQEAGADCWAEAITSNQSSLSDDLRQVHFGLDLGFRVGVGYGMKHDQWDTTVYYTWFYTKGTDHTSRGPGSIHSTFIGNFYVNNPEGSGISGPAYESASIAWTIRFNMVDWDLGRNFWISKSLALRPFIGIKGGSIHQFIHSKWQNPEVSESDFFNVGIENLKNNFWGIGPEAGIDTKWVLFNAENHFLSLFGNISGAVMWGHWSLKDVYYNDIQQKITVNPQSLNSGAPMVRVLTGLEWNMDFEQNRYRFSTKLGYEMQFWLKQLHFYSFTGGRLDNQLTLQGGTLEFSFDF